MPTKKKKLSSRRGTLRTLKDGKEVFATDIQEMAVIVKQQAIQVSFKSIFIEKKVLKLKGIKISHLLSYGDNTKIYNEISIEADQESLQ